MTRSKLSFILPVALGDTGRPGNDAERMTLLLETFLRFFRREDLEIFLIVTRPQDVRTVSGVVESAGARNLVDVVSETDLCPVLAQDPDTPHYHPVYNKGWYRQQLLKLAAAEHLNTDFYMTLDADVAFTRPFQHSTLIRAGRSVVNVLTESDFHHLFNGRIASDSIAVRRDRDARAAAILDLTRGESGFYGETPVVLSRTIVKALLNRIEEVHQEEWTSCLIRNIPWTEYTLYFTFAEARGLFDQHHVRGGANSVLRMADSLWYASEDYRIPRSLESWTWTTDGVAEGVAVVVQSYNGYSIDDVRRKVFHLARMR